MTAPDTAQETAPETAPETDQADSTAATPTPDVLPRLRGIPALVSSLKANHAPPDVWSQDHPSLRKIWTYAKHGEWSTHSTGLVRNLGKGYARFVAMPFSVWARCVQFATERPSRALVTLAFVEVINFTPFGHAVLRLALPPFIAPVLAP